MLRPLTDCLTTAGIILLCMLSAFSVNAQDRILLINSDQQTPIQYHEEELGQLFGLEQVTIFDPQYQMLKSYEGVSFRALLNSAGFEEGQQLMLVCKDGYQVPFDSSLLEDQSLNPMLVLRDTDSEENSHWVGFEHGREIVNFDPFYLIWERAENTDQLNGVALESLPWPYQLTEIRNVDIADYAPAAPDDTASTNVSKGFDVFYQHCFKCHTISSVGGSLGPILDRESGLVSVLNDAQLKSFIWNINNFYPVSKMPDYSNSLTEIEVDQVLSYLRWIIPPN